MPWTMGYISVLGTRTRRADREIGMENEEENLPGMPPVRLRRLRALATNLLRRHSIAPGRIDASDLAQEVWLRMAEAWRRGLLPASLEQRDRWAFGTLRHVLADELEVITRARPVSPDRIELCDGDPVAQSEGTGSCEDWKPDPRLLEVLTSKQAAAVRLILAGHDLLSAAACLGVDRASLVERIRRATRRLRPPPPPPGAYAVLPVIDEDWFRGHPRRWHRAYALRRNGASHGRIASELGCTREASRCLLRRIRREWASCCESAACASPKPTLVPGSE